MSSIAHLARRFAGSFSRAEPVAADVEWVAAHLSSAELALWGAMCLPDRRHSLVVARRFVARQPDASRAEVAGALLHDVGKQVAGLGTFGRVVATLVGPRTRRFRAYHDHERLGAELLARAGSESATIELVGRRGRLAEALRQADEV